MDLSGIIDSWPRCKMAEVVNRFGELAEKNHLEIEEGKAAKTWVTEGR